MFRIEKYNWNMRNRLYFSSDWHIFHNPSWDNPIWKMRGYESSEDAAEKIQAEINKTVGDNDILYYLGDLFLNATDDQCFDWLAGMNCKNIKILFGNHESNIYRIYKQEMVKQYGRDDIEVYPLKMGNVEFVGNHVEIRVGKQHIVMNHFPLKIWNGNNASSWNLSGHSHLSDTQRHPSFPLGKCMDVGWEYKSSVWSFEQIEDIMSTKSIHIQDHHNSP